MSARQRVSDLVRPDESRSAQNQDAHRFGRFRRRRRAAGVEVVVTEHHRVGADGVPRVEPVDVRDPGGPRSGRGLLEILLLGHRRLGAPVVEEDDLVVVPVGGADEHPDPFARQEAANEVPVALVPLGDDRAGGMLALRLPVLGLGVEPRLLEHRLHHVGNGLVLEHPGGPAQPEQLDPRGHDELEHPLAAGGHRVGRLEDEAVEGARRVSLAGQQAKGGGLPEQAVGGDALGVAGDQAHGAARAAVERLLPAEAEHTPPVGGVTAGLELELERARVWHLTRSGS